MNFPGPYYSYSSHYCLSMLHRWNQDGMALLLLFLTDADTGLGVMDRPPECPTSEMRAPGVGTFFMNGRFTFKKPVGV